jgi:hypothetical protein
MPPSMLPSWCVNNGSAAPSNLTLLTEVFWTSSLQNNRLFVQWNRPDFSTFRLDTLAWHDIYVNFGIAV